MGGTKTRAYVDIMSCAPEVTGSCILLVIKYDDGKKVKGIVDCGLFQEKDYSKHNREFPFNPEELEFALVTHNHIDHTGRLPLLVKKGFYKKIYMTETTKKLANLALYDSYKVLRGVAKRENTSELYSDSDVKRTIEKIEGIEYNSPTFVHQNVKATFFKNGHLIGAAMILLQIIRAGYEDINLLFTGDYNNKNMFFDVSPVPQLIRQLPLTIIQESTYGDMNSDEISECFVDNVLGAIKKDKTALIPVFSLGRAQEILYLLKTMQQKGTLSKDIPIYFDGKLAIQYTGLYLNAELGIKEEMKEFLPENLTYSNKLLRRELLYDTSVKIILTTSGMGSYGPAQTYIPAYLSREDALIQFTGFTAEGTLGNRLKNTPKGEPVDVAGLVVIKKADVEYTTEFSAHAKADEMIDFLQQFENLKLVLVNHGEIDVKEKFAKRILKEVQTKYVGILGNEYFFRVDHYGLVKTMSTKY